MLPMHPEIDRDGILHPSQSTSPWPPTVAAVRRRHDGRRVPPASSGRITVLVGSRAALCGAGGSEG